MIFPETLLNVADNSGARLVKCIHLFKISKTKGARLGDFILVSIKKTGSVKKIKKGEVHGAIIVRTRKEVKRPTGEIIKFSDNAVVLVDKKKMPLGTRIMGPIPLELRSKGLLKILSLATQIL